ncbi:MAG: DUF5908 family protein [Bacteroidales bacterium]
MNAFGNFVFEPANITIALLNSSHVPVQAWYVVNAIPKSGPSATLMPRKIWLLLNRSLCYQFFNVISVESLQQELFRLPEVFHFKQDSGMPIEIKELAIRAVVSNGNNQPPVTTPHAADPAKLKKRSPGK